MATQKKIDAVAELSDKIGKTKSMVFVDYTGIKHKQLETLRKSLKAADAEFAVTKNTLMLRALGDKAESLKPMLKASTATVFSYKDEVTGIKELTKFLKAVGLGKTKGGALGDTVLTDKDLDRLAKLPGREALLGQLAGQLMAPVQGLHYALRWNLQSLVMALSAVKAKKA
jgi:large subunit ribosomal protein L10